MTDSQKVEGQQRHANVRRCLNSHYYSSSSETANSFLIGSWARATRVRPPRDIDLMYILPPSVEIKYQNKSGNKQSQLLQEVRGVLSQCFISTTMSADGQVVIASFSTQSVEVVPCFATYTSQYKICDTNGGGLWKLVDPGAQQESLQASDANSSGNTRDLVRMLKKWQNNCAVPLKSFWLELLSEKFIDQWAYRGESSVYYDYMVRDFFAYLIHRANTHIILPNTYEAIYLGDAWKSKAESASSRSIKGCEYEAASKDYDAWWEWKNIFGEDVPRD